MKTFFLFTVIFGITSIFYSPKRYLLPEYNFYYTPDSCTEQTTQTISGYRYLQIRFSNNCKDVEVSCFRDADSTIMESGFYKNVGKRESHQVQTRSVSSDKSKVEKTYFYRLQRCGTWSFFDSTGNKIKTVVY